MKTNWQEKQTEFWQKGFTIFDDFFPEDVVKKWRKTAMLISNSPEQFEGVKRIEKKFDTEDKETRDGSGIYSLTSINGNAVFTGMFQDLETYYKNFVSFLSLFTGLDIVTSFDRQSAVTIMVYEPPAGQMLSHYDTQDISVLLYLTDNDEGGTEIYPITAKKPTVLGQPDEIVGTPEIILPKTGRIAIFRGQQCWHTATPVEHSIKVSSAWNYYIKGNNFRPAGVSERLYK